LDTDEALASSRRALTKANDANAASLARIERGEQNVAARQAAAESAARKLVDVEQRLLRERMESAGVTNRIVSTESQLGAMRRQHAVTADQILKTERSLRTTRQAEAGDVDRSRRLYELLQKQREQYRAESNAMRHASLDLAQAKDAEGRATAGVSFLERSMNSLRQEATRQTRDRAAAERELTKATQDSARVAEAAQREAARVERAERQRNNARHRFTEAERERPGRGGGRGGGGLGGFERGLGGVFTSIPFVPGGKAGAIIGTGLITGLGGVLEAATTATQALWLLPAATAAAGAGFATLKIGLSGFDKALKDMGDAKKFAKDLQGLAPNAQQAALEIQHLVGGLSGLKNIIQQSLFDGVAKQLHNLGNAFMPSLKQMFTGISGAFNQMFNGAVGQLTSSGSVASIGNIINNIVKAFQNLTPAIAPVIDAFTRLTQVGSTFLPGLGSSIADLAKHFDDFIIHAQQTGELQKWIRQGLDAARELGHFIGELGRKFYEVFGGKSPQQFSQTLSTVVGTLTAIGKGMVTLSNTVNGLVQDLNPVARALGGWPNLIRDVIAVWALWKVGGLISDLMKVGTLLGITLPAAAESGAGRISAALAAIKMPAWIATFLALWNLHGDSGPGTHEGADPAGPGSKQANDYRAKQDAGQAYQKAHGGKMPDNYQQWLEGRAPMPKGIDQYYHPGQAPRGAPGTPDAGNKPDWWYDSYWDKAPNSAGMGPWSPSDVPGVPGKGGVGADRDATPYGPGYSAAPRPGQSEEEYSAEGAVMDAKHRLEQDKATLLKMQQDNNVTAEEKQAQENKLAKDQREIYEAQMRLTDAQQNAYKKNLKGIKDANDEFNNIDQDFGLSQGLPGLVKNLVGMLGDIATAPMMRQLKATANATGTDKNTFGMLGMMGQQNIAEGKSPLLGIAAGQPGGPGVAPGGIPWGTPGAGPWDKGYGGGPGGVSTTPATGPMPGAGPGSIAPGVATAGYTTGASGVQLAGAIHPVGARSGGLNWDALAAKESSGNWATNTGNGYFGGLQFDQATWNAYKPAGAPSNPAQATKEQQIAAGQAAISARGGPQSLWPQNYGQLGSGGSGANGGPGNGQQDKPYHSPQAPWSAQYDSYQPMGSWLGGSGGGSAPAGDSVGFGGGGGGSFPGLQGLGNNLPDVRGAHPQEAYALQAIQRLFPWAQLTAGNYDHPKDNGWHGRGQAIDIGGGNAGQQAQLSNWLTQFAPEIEELIHSGPGVTQNIKSGRLGPAIDMPGSTYNTGQAGYHGDHVHLAITDSQAQPFIDALSGGAPQSPFGGIPQVQTPVRLSDFSSPLGADGGAGAGPPWRNPNPLNWMSPAVGGTGAGGGSFPSGGLGGADGGAGAMPAPPGGGGDPAAPPTPIGAPPGGGWQPQGGGGNGIGGLPLAAISSAAGMFPGGGAAAQTAMQLANRTIGYGQQVGAIAVQGLMDTFKISSPDGDDGGKSDLSKGWAGRVAAGFAGARPAMPNGAGAAPQAKKDSDPSKDPDGKAALGQDPGDTHNVYGGMNIPGSGNTININPPGQSSMGDANAGLSAASSAPATTSFAGAI
jgi:hypothetical protein